MIKFKNRNEFTRNSPKIAQSGTNLFKQKLTVLRYYIAPQVLYVSDPASQNSNIKVEASSYCDNTHQNANMYPSNWQMFVVLISLIFLLSFTYGVKSEVGSVSGVYAETNGRKYMEDFSVRIESVFGTGFYAILDGHGGDYSSKYAKKFLTKEIVNVLRTNHSDHGKSKYARGPNEDIDLGKMLTDFTDQMEAHLEAETINGGHRSGSTCLMIVAEKDKLTVGNVGDSRGVMCDSKFRAIDLSVDHKAGENEDEEKRMVKENRALHKRVKGRICGLAVTRALGDFETKIMAGKNVISSKPEIFQFNLIEHKPNFMILASDGLWDELSSQTAVDFIKERYLKDADFGAKALAVKAIKAGSKDNITVMIVVFKNGIYQISTSIVGKMKKVSRKVTNCFQS